MRQLIYGMAIAFAVTFAPMVAEAGNQKMVESVANMLQSSDLAEGCDIGLKYQNNTIWLTGTVPSEAKRVAIEACVFHVKGVDKVVNELQVTAVTGKSEEEVSPTIEDSDVQAAAYQRSILRNRPLLQRGNQCQPYTVGNECGPCTNPNNVTGKSMLTSRQPSAQSLVPEGARIISDEVVSVEPMVGLNAPTTPMIASHAPAVGSNYPVVMPPAQTAAPQVQVVTTPQMQMPVVTNRVPMRQVNYTVTHAVPVQQYQVASTPLPMNSPAYAKQTGPSMRYDQPHLPRQAWPSYASYPNTAAVQYPKRYCAKSWPFIGPFYPYPQVPDGWRKVTLEWHDGYWHLDFDDGSTKGPCRGLFRMNP